MHGDLQILFSARGIARVVRDREAGRRSASAALENCMLEDS